MKITQWLPIIPTIQTGWGFAAFAILLALALYLHPRK
jgi:hypothetical protein